MESLRKVLFVTTTLSAVAFFNPLHFLDDTNAKLVFYVFSLLSFVYGVGFTPRQRIGIKSYSFLLLSIVISMLMASAFHNQSMAISIKATIPFLFGYLFLYTLIRFQLDEDYIEKVIMVLCITSMIIYCVDFITFPNSVFGNVVKGDNSRGMTRIIPPMIELLVFLVFYSIYKYRCFFQKKWIVIGIVALVFVVLSLTRQYIILTVGLGLLYLLKNVSLMKKLFITVSFCTIVWGAFEYIPIFQAMRSFTQKQIHTSKTKDEDIRIKAVRFYTYEYQTNSLSPILGNGIPSFTSPWGREVKRKTFHNHCFAHDVGWAGMFWYFGLLGTLSLLLFLKKMMVYSYRIKPYICYWFMFILLASLASGPILYHNEIISISIISYLAIAYGKENRSNNIEL